MKQVLKIRDNSALAALLTRPGQPTPTEPTDGSYVESPDIPTKPTAPTIPTKVKTGKPPTKPTNPTSETIPTAPTLFQISARLPMGLIEWLYAELYHGPREQTMQTLMADIVQEAKDRRPDKGPAPPKFIEDMRAKGKRKKS